MVFESVYIILRAFVIYRHCYITGLVIAGK